MIDISGLSYHIGKRAIFEDASAFVAKGAKVGLVGLNGAGKTTLFKLFLGKINLDDGARGYLTCMNAAERENKKDRTRIRLKGLRPDRAFVSCYRLNHSL
jgi:ATPase subunit of ABC transporter with duplicated ATPase domains